MKPVHYLVVVNYIEYGEPDAEIGEHDHFIYETLDEVLDKFPTFRKSLEPDRAHRYLRGNMYGGTYLTRLSLTEDDIDGICPSEQELRDFYQNIGGSYRKYCNKQKKEGK